MTGQDDRRSRPDSQDLILQGVDDPGAREAIKRSLAMTPEERERRRQNAIAEHRAAAAPIIADLRAAGFQVESLDELRRSGSDYSDALSVLLFWLPRVPSFDVKESLVRCLTVPWARGVAARPILAEFFAAPQEESSFRWSVGNAMDVIADNSVADELVQIVSDPANGTARQMFVLALRRVKHPRTVGLLMDLLSDEQVAGHALISLGDLGAVEARARIEVMLQDPKAWVRKAAKAALAKISRRQA